MFTETKSIDHTEPLYLDFVCNKGLFSHINIYFHLQGPSMMADIVTVAMLIRRILGEENNKVFILHFIFHLLHHF